MTTECASELAGKYLPRVMSAARGWAKRYRYLRDEFESSALLALSEVIARNRMGDGEDFARYLNAAVRNKCRNVLRAEGRHQRGRVGLALDGMAQTEPNRMSGAISADERRQRGQREYSQHGADRTEPNLDDLVSAGERAAEGGDHA